MAGLDGKDGDFILELDPDEFDWEHTDGDGSVQTEGAGVEADNSWVVVEDARLIDPSLGEWIMDLVLVTDDMTFEQKRASFQDLKRLENLKKHGIASVNYDKETGIVRLQYLASCTFHQLPGAVFQILKKYSNGIGAYRSVLRVPKSMQVIAREKSINEVPVSSWMPPAEEKIRAMAVSAVPQIIEKDSREIDLEEGNFTYIQLQLQFDVNIDGEINPKTGQKNLSADKYAENSRIFSEVILPIVNREALSTAVIMLSVGKITLKKKPGNAGGLNAVSIAALMKYVAKVS